MLTSIKRVVKRRLAALAANVLTDVLHRESSHQLFDISSERQRHVLGAHPSREPKLTGPYTYEHSFHEPMVFFGFLAAITTRLELVTGILILPQRQTVLVAKQTAEVDVLSGGRLRLGIGIGWNYVEYDALGESFQTRGRRVEEQIEVLRKLWTQPLVTYKTTHHVIDNAGINPLPIRRPIPIWFGGAAKPGLRRAARIGDGWMPAGRPPDNRMKVYVDQLHGYLEAAGRDPKQFGIDPWISIQGLDKDEWHRRVEAWCTLGATHLAVDTMRAGFTSPKAHMAAIRSFREVLS